jgi:hypothetical protein
MAVKAVADQFAETLAAVGVKRIYSIVGDSLYGLTDAIRRQPRGSGSRQCGRRADRACDASITGDGEGILALHGEGNPEQSHRRDRRPREAKSLALRGIGQWKSP